MAEFVQFTLDDGSVVMFESAESDLVAQHGGEPEVREGGKPVGLPDHGTLRINALGPYCNRESVGLFD